MMKATIIPTCSDIGIAVLLLVVCVHSDIPSVLLTLLQILKAIEDGNKFKRPIAFDILVALGKN